METESAYTIVPDSANLDDPKIDPDLEKAIIDLIYPSPTQINPSQNIDCNETMNLIDCDELMNLIDYLVKIKLVSRDANTTFSKPQTQEVSHNFTSREEISDLDEFQTRIQPVQREIIEFEDETENTGAKEPCSCKCRIF